MRGLVGIFLILFSGISISSPNVCSYSTYMWNVYSKKAEKFQQIQKPYSELTEEEIDKNTGCTVCQEDQVELYLENIPPFKVCKIIAADIQVALEKSISSGQSVVEVIGYRVGKTKGDVDQYGYRTQFSNHSFGTAIDVNPEYNGLYDNCISYSSTCRLIKGGNWSPSQPESLSPNSYVVQIMRSIGFNWGGEIQGKQKDFMHFSLSGY